MTRYLSLVRGINIGGRVVKMAELQSVYQDAGLTNIKTLIQSGNVLFDSDLPADQLQAKLEAVVSQTFAFDAKIFVISREDLAAIIEAYPFDSSDERFQHYLIFLRPGLAKDLVAAANLDSEGERAVAGHDVVYWQVQKGLTLKTGMAKAMNLPKFRDYHTNRNIKTLKKALDL